MARTDEIDELVSSVRNLVSHKEAQKVKSRDRLMLTPELRVAGEDDLPDNVLVLETGQPPVADREGLEATIAELEAAVTAQSDDWEADGGENFEEQEAWAVSAFEVRSRVLDLEAEAEAQRAAELAEINAAVEAADAAAEAAVETPAVEPEAAIEEQPDDEVARTPEVSEENIAELDAIEAAVADRLTKGIDEAELRALVVATVHEELSGELGERITRNVRKLVRREINRVLASQDLGQD